MRLKSRSMYTPLIYSASIMEVQIHIYSIQIHLEKVLLLHWERALKNKKIYAYHPFLFLASYKAPNIPFATSCQYIQREAWVL
jgi:hypothetical protein